MSLSRINVCKLTIKDNFFWLTEHVYKIKNEIIVQSPLVIVYLIIVESLDIVDKTWETDFLLNKFSCNSGFSCFSQILNSEHFFERPSGADRYKMIK